MAFLTNPTVLIFLGGIVPALLWLWFWLKEDAARPEPKKVVAIAFLVGMVAVPLVLPFEQFAASLLGPGIALIIAWSLIEELMKYGLAYAFVLRRCVVDEPIDVVVYLITAALGFAALENVFFLLTTFSQGGAVDTILTGNLRFLGATLLHTLSSATVGVALALSFYKRPLVRRLALSAGLVLAVALHALFNFFIIELGGENVLPVFVGVWIGILALILIFEKVKRIKRPRSLVS